MYHILAFFHIFVISRIAPKGCGAHDCGMVAFRRRVFARGVSIVAALVFVAILSAVAVGVQSTVPSGNPESQTAATAPATPAAAAPKADSSPVECSALKKEVLTDKAEKAEKEPCVCLDSKARAYRSVKYQVEAQLQKNGNPAVKTTAVISSGTISTGAYMCVIEKCAPESKGTKCEPIKLNQADFSQKLSEAQTSARDEYGKGMAIAIADGRIKAETLNGKMSQTTQDSIASAFQSDVKGSYLPNALDPYSNKVLPYSAADLAVTEKEIANFKICGETECPDGKPATPDPLKLNPNDPTTLTSEEAATMPLSIECNADKSYCFGFANPTDAGKLTAQGFTCAKDDDGTYGCERDKSQQCPPGSSGTPPNCVRGGPGTTFQNPNAGSTQSPTNPSSSSGPLDSFLKGLMGAFRPTPPAPPRATPQQCATEPNAYAQQQQQYQQQMQQYQYQLQMYQYQQQQSQYYTQQGMTPPPMQPLPAQPVPCTPSTQQQCQTQPQQPNPNNCSVGFWQPVYSGTCITGWQCIPRNTPNPPVATLSCEPPVADVGMPIAITYGCSSGLATSSSFTVTTQPGGSATTTVANPPQGANTATYSLACVDQGRTSGAQCSIQVSRPSIILVANPKTVTLGGTSLISWLTTGMDSCVISSPDQQDFTERNSAYTSVNGVATTSPISASSTAFLLRCGTFAGGVREATTTVLLATSTSAE
ncbi:hypothetical protein A3D71_00030 [Candidatus Kaiserbacteria bacterium RIFCSPHIGHO2_02_FULL_55_20]|uniref:Uncharacterized protein n=1 Tax=Candidatus Kaiserbacteria bacterium RIFCSPHIGHO2_02_FULL_55_20 TaxID=1798497 RepID=A0A1F6DYP3_9BACT|nr:MAG: hypothetical protein A2680_01040 [Candidatus Kaiserbacteria bacterium RIFCSPHIGHO2_01_FULL_55_37]OGG66539.1 MAG: hypothetical protein A3D71_00030 [Candidatus Kaiserbacteria bacterium RIFCSPHIGHO2_02_FULL_55_20]